jgi:hypothetical protein
VSDKLKKVGEVLLDLATPDTQEAAPQASPTVPVSMSSDGIAEYNPPADWAPAEPPTAADEEEKLTEAFGEPVNGVYAPHVEEL